MKLSSLKKLCAAILLLSTGSFVKAQPQVYTGPGMGFDFGGLGGKIELLPIKHLGVFGGLGYNLRSIGWNVGATYKILPDKKFSPNPMFMYGYNGVMNGEVYSGTSYGVSFGANLDMKLGQQGNKLTVGLFIPIRSKKFMDAYEELENNPSATITTPLLPFAVSVGYVFKL